MSKLNLRGFQQLQAAQELVDESFVGMIEAQVARRLAARMDQFLAHLKPGKAADSSYRALEARAQLATARARLDQSLLAELIGAAYPGDELRSRLLALGLWRDPVKPTGAKEIPAGVTSAEPPQGKSDCGCGGKSATGAGDGGQA